MMEMFDSQWSLLRSSSKPMSCLRRALHFFVPSAMLTKSSFGDRNMCAQTSWPKKNQGALLDALTEVIRRCQRCHANRYQAVHIIVKHGSAKRWALSCKTRVLQTLRFTRRDPMSSPISMRRFDLVQSKHFLEEGNMGRTESR